MNGSWGDDNGQRLQFGFWDVAYSQGIMSEIRMRRRVRIGLQVVRGL